MGEKWDNNKYHMINFNVCTIESKPLKNPTCPSLNLNKGNYGCLSPFELLSQNITDTVPYKQHKLVSASSGS